MIADQCKQMDKLNTRSSTGVPNFRKSGGGYPVYGMGQPTRNGLSRLMDDLQKEGCPVSIHAWIYLFHLSSFSVTLSVNANVLFSQEVQIY